MNDYRAKVVKNNVPHPCFLQNFKRLYKRYNKRAGKHRRLSALCCWWRGMNVGVKYVGNAIRAGWRGARVAG